MKQYFKSENGRSQIFAMYEAKLASLQVETHSMFIETDFGTTHLLVTGDAKNPPLILIHGSNAFAPIALEAFPNLTEKYQVFAIDIPAQPNKSTGERMSMKDDSYGRWMHEIIRKLELKNV